MGQPSQSLKGSPKLGSYLKKLRSGYGYSLRRVEERARAEGGEIDNSQLSRYEKGICYPSFDKLRVLASVFNVSIQSFSDVVDLEEFEDLRPAVEDVPTLVERGQQLSTDGEYGHALVHFEAALDELGSQSNSTDQQRQLAEVRLRVANVLKMLGKLSLSEQEVRHALRRQDLLSPRDQVSGLLLLASVHSNQGDYMLAEMEAERAFKLASEAGESRAAAHALTTQGKTLAHQGNSQGALDSYREAVKLYEESGCELEAIRTRINLGTTYIELGKRREGMRLLQATVTEARNAKHRRAEALAWTNLGEAYMRESENDRARSCFRESDALAVYNHERFDDVLFFNAYYQWKMAINTGNPTREKIAFGRLKALRSTLESHFPEVDAFDAYVEGGRAHA